MGSWGPDAFANDAALDAAVEMVSVREVATALVDFLIADTADDDPASKLDAAYAAAEIVAAAHSDLPYWQSEGTTLSGAGDAYVPEEVAAFLKTAPVFTDEQIANAIRVTEILEEKVEREGWHVPGERVDALRATRTRLLNPMSWHPIQPGVLDRLSPLAEKA